MDQVQKQQNCPVCMEKMVKSVKTECNHEFCVKCLFKWVFLCVDEREKIDCPLCRQTVWMNNLKWIKPEENKEIRVESS
ncbi:unnamed protein product [Chironomus riparius]|uniref:RING-type domain-containing protein n=1 Tax=Chironomus riparius TaxID=315576 RepID=A0A9N9S487_9DIPT|nr:unnamed protein product [Chironomus riparius]